MDENEKQVTVSAVTAETEVKAMVALARQFPRDTVRALDRILSECDRVSLAEVAVYSYPRGGQQVTGPSIRLAEALARAWGNIAAGVNEVERGEGWSKMLAYAWDLETNVIVRKEFRVSHVRDTKSGRVRLNDERDIYEMTANLAARRLRSCILALIPGDVVDKAVERCEKTLTVKVGNLEERIPKLIATFEAVGVSKAMLEKKIGHRIEAIQPAEFVNLGNIYNSIKDGFGKPTDYFEPVALPPKSPAEILKPVKGSGEKVEGAKPLEGEKQQDGENDGSHEKPEGLEIF